MILITGATSAFATSNISGVDLFLRKYDLNGNVKWTKQIEIVITILHGI